MHSLYQTYMFAGDIEQAFVKWINIFFFENLIGRVHNDFTMYPSRYLLV